jgi:tetratricopeptide (TPR) repeat protein
MRQVLTYTLSLIAILLSIYSHAQSIQNAPRDERLNQFQLAELQMKNANFQDALQTYTGIIINDQYNAMAYMKRAQVYQILGMNKESMEDYNKAIALNPYSEYIYDGRAKVKMLAADYKGAINDINEALRIRPTNRDLLNYRVDYYIMNKEFEKALGDLDTLINCSYDNYNCMLKKAIIYMQGEELNEAEDAVEAAIQLNDTSAVAYDLQGLIHTQRRAYKAAIESYNKSIELDPKFAIAYYNRGMAYRLSGDETRALTDFDRAWQMAQTDASLYFLKKENDEALGLDTGEYQGIDTNYTDALINRAVSSKYTGDLNGALTDVNKAIALNDRDAVAFNTRGNIYMLFGEYQNAISDYSHAIDIDGSYAKAYYNRALARIIVYANSAACSDLRTAASLGYNEAEQKRQYFCRGGNYDK